LRRLLRRVTVVVLGVTTLSVVEGWLRISAAYAHEVYNDIIVLLAAMHIVLLAAMHVSMSMVQAIPG
jgi:hypothetical protein